MPKLRKPTCKVQIDHNFSAENNEIKNREHWNIGTRRFKSALPL